MTSPQFTTQEEIQAGAYSGAYFRISNFVIAANNWFLSTPLQEEIDVGDTIFGSLLVPAQIPEQQKVRLTRYAEEFALEDAVDLVNEITNNITQDPEFDKTVSKAEVESFVLNNLYRDWEYDEENQLLTPSGDLEPVEGKAWHNVARLYVNNKQRETLRDPSALLFEDKLKIGVRAAVNNESFGPDSKAIGFLILGEGLGIDLETPLSQTEEIRLTPIVKNVVSDFTKSIPIVDKEFTSVEGKTNYSNYLTQIVNKDAYRLFGPIVAEEDLGSINYRKFRQDGIADSAGRGFTDVINRWIDESGGNSSGEGLINDALKATMETNRYLIKEAQKILEKLLDDDGNIDILVQKEAVKAGKDPEKYVAEKVYEYIGEQFVEGEDNLSPFDTMQTDRKAILDWKNLHGSLDKQNKALASMLREDETLWVENEQGIRVPVTKDEVSPADWDNWRHYYLQNGPELTKAHVTDKVSDSVNDFRGTPNVLPENLRTLLDESRPPSFTSVFRIEEKGMPNFDRSIFDTQIDSQWSDQRPEFAAFIKHQLNTTDFKEKYLKQAVPQPIDDREAAIELQNDLLTYYRERYAQAEASYNADTTNENFDFWKDAEKDLFKAEDHYRRETGQSKFGLSTSEDNQAEAYFDYSQKKGALPGEAVGYTFTGTDPNTELPYDAATLSPEQKAKAYQAAKSESDQMYPTKADVFAKGTSASDEDAVTVGKLFATTPKTESEFLKSMVPGFEQQYKQSAFYKAEQERLGRLARTGEDEATQKRRQQLRTLNTGRSIFTRARR